MMSFSPNIDFSGISQAVGGTPASALGVEGADGMTMAELGRAQVAKYGRRKTGGLVSKLRDRVKRVGSSVADYGKRAVGNVEDYGKRAKEQAIEGYRRYKDPIIVGAGTALGAILGSIVPVVGTMTGAAAGGSIAAGARGAKVARDQQKDAEDQIDAFNAQNQGLSLTDLMRLRRLRRGAGEGVAEYQSQGTGPYDAYEVAA